MNELFIFSLILFLSFFGNVVGTVSGFGLGTIMTPLVALFLPFSQTVLLICIIHLFHDIWRLMFFRVSLNIRLLLIFGIPSIVMSIIGAQFITYQSTWLTFCLGLFLIMYVFFLFYMPHFKISPTATNGIIGGSLSGFSAGIFGIRGAIRTAFLSAYDLRKKEFISTTATISLLIDSARLITYLHGNIQLPTYISRGIILFIPATFLGTLTGKYVLGTIAQRYFRLMVAFFLLLVGIKFILDPFLF